MDVYDGLLKTDIIYLILRQSPEAPGTDSAVSTGFQGNGAAWPQTWYVARDSLEQLVLNAKITGVCYALLSCIYFEGGDGTTARELQMTTFFRLLRGPENGPGLLIFSVLGLRHVNMVDRKGERPTPQTVPCKNM